MAIHVALYHKSAYHYGRPVSLGPHVVRLRPAPHTRSPIISYSMRVQPAGHFVNWQQDPDSNYLARLVFPEKISNLTVEIDLVAELAVHNPFDFFLEPSANEFPFTYDDTELLELAPFLRRDALTPRFQALVHSVDLTRRATVGFLVELNQRLSREVKYLVRPEPGVHCPEETLQRGEGSCRDSAVLLVQLLRHLGLAARFVSGYLIQLKPDQVPLDGPAGVEQDFCDLHAWTEVYLPGAGWIGFDPTSGLLAGEGHIPLACSPEPSGAAPISGTREPGASTFTYEMSVKRIRETPRVTLPYTDEQWTAINALGELVDARLEAGGARLATGSRPTFVSLDDRDSAEWNTDILGPTKRSLAEGLVRKLREEHTTDCSLVVEGQAPPADPRLPCINVAPAAGVIQVDLPLSTRWRDLVEETESVFRVARAARLGAEKFMLDGRHTGTGGGNHIVFGAGRPEDTPLRHRPLLPASLVNYWHQHPSLSYLFSGQFIGPDGPAPRLDEMHGDAASELETANEDLIRQLESGAAVSSSLVTGIYHQLLAAVSKNIRRAEFDVEESSGLVELRAFEMPPHARMSLAQQLLVRALMARFWDEPCLPRQLVHWDTDLHDRFLLPHYVWEDFAGVIEDLGDHGLRVDLRWFAPHFEFRFPFHGHVTYRGIELELRHALEPWQIVKGQPGADESPAFIDSSVERLQVKVTGLVPERYVVACNGVRVPLRPTGVRGEFVAGVRFRAWPPPPPSGHPAIGVHSPLVFDLIDTWNGRALGGCQYHVAHPGGRNYTSLPVNAPEAESRRLSRFLAFGHTPGQGLPELPGETAELRCTLDLLDPPKELP